MHFEESYFAAETRDGFFIEEKMKRAWAAQIEVLLVIDRICKKNNISYFADSGTLLGAVRHHGFIPWDDDIDISMKRDDYEKFLTVAVSELPENYILLNERTTVEYTEPYARIVNGNSINFTPVHLINFHGCPYVVGIDIFPLDYLPVDETELLLQKELCRIVWAAHTISRKNHPENSELETALLHVEELCNIKLHRNEPITHQLTRLFDQIARLYHREESEDLALISEYIISGKYRMKKEWYDNIIYLPFENISIPAPKHYSDCLTTMYGENYMAPVKNAAYHDYPFYKDQEKILESLNQRTV